MTEHCICGAAIHGATLCANCTHELAVALADIAAHSIDLDTLRAKQARYTTAMGRVRSSRDTPLPVDGRFTDTLAAGSQLEWETRNTVVAWTRDLLEKYPPLTGPACRFCSHDSCTACKRRRHPADTVPAMCAYLLGWTDRMRTDDDGPLMLDELQNLRDRLRRFVDRPPDRWYAGVCGSEGECDGELYAATTDTDVRCPVCGAEYPVKARREWLLAEAENVLATASEIARAVVVWSDYDRGENRLVKRIDAWRSRNRITAKGSLWIGDRKLDTYRVGDVLDLLGDELRHEAQRESVTTA